MIKIAPSILAADPLNLERDALRMVEAGCDWLHVDVMDAHFVPNMAFTPSVVAGLRKITDVPLDVHLMMDNPEKYLDVFLDAGASGITIHAEIPGNVRGMLSHIRERGALAGIAIKPGTPAEDILDLLESADMVLTMTVEPGFGGQKLNENVPEKMKFLRQQGYTGEIEADGGLNEENLPWLIESGLSVAVMGSAMYHAADPRAVMERMHRMG